MPFSVGGLVHNHTLGAACPCPGCLGQGAFGEVGSTVASVVAITGSALVPPAVSLGAVDPEVGYISGVTTAGGLYSQSYWIDNGTNAHEWTAATAYSSSAGQLTLTYSVQDFGTATPTATATFLEALGLWSAVAGVRFIAAPAGTTPDIVLTKGTSGAFTDPPPEAGAPAPRSVPAKTI